jgi:hypothetical protein
MILCLFKYIHTLTPEPRRGSRGVSDIRPRRPRFTIMIELWGILHTWQPIAVWLQSISGGRSTVELERILVTNAMTDLCERCLTSAIADHWASALTSRIHYYNVGRKFFYCLLHYMLHFASLYPPYISSRGLAVNVLENSLNFEFLICLRVLFWDSSLPVKCLRLAWWCLFIFEVER